MAVMASTSDSKDPGEELRWPRKSATVSAKVCSS